MTLSNPTNGQPLIYRIMDALGVSHLVACINHTHEQSEVEGLPAALNNKAPINHDHTSIGEDTDESAAEVIANEGRVHIEVREVSEGGGECDITPSNIGNLARALETPDSTPTTGSDKLVTSGGVKAALEGKQGTLTFDSTPTANSTNPVTSGGVKVALDEKQDKLSFDSTPTAESTNPVTSGGIRQAILNAILPVEHAVPEVVSLASGDSINLDTLSMTPQSLRRIIIANETGGILPVVDTIYAEDLPVHRGIGTDVTIAVGGYALVTVYRINSSAHTHYNCYFVVCDATFDN